MQEPDELEVKAKILHSLLNEIDKFNFSAMDEKERLMHCLDYSQRFLKIDGELIHLLTVEALPVVKAIRVWINKAAIAKGMPEQYLQFMNGMIDDVERRYVTQKRILQAFNN
jgi:hypothetical protein